ncbi:MAG: glycosyltransferase family 4 protein [Magnetospirillum sp.]|nr:glycosyltransferase family 4 protein [Magnetospirillum sp.]
MAFRLLYLVSHPIQYQAPLLRRIAADGDIDLHVLFESDHTFGEFFDEGFKHQIRWDTELTTGYRWSVLSSVRDVARHMKTADAVWLHGWDSWARLGALALRRPLGVPVLMRGENNDVSMPDGSGTRAWVKRRFLEWLLPRCDAFLCIGSDNREYYRRRGVREERLHLVPYAVDNHYFRTRAEEGADQISRLRRSLDIAEDRPVVLYSGKLQPRKHPRTLLAAFTMLDREALGDPVLLFVGEGEERDRLKADAALLGNSVRLLGFRNQSELPAFYAMADVFVLASAREPWGLAVNEAMNAGTAVIVSEECGCAADLITAETGLVVPAGKAVPLARALTTLLSDRARCAAMGEAARRHIAGWDYEADVRGLKAALASIR